MFKDNFGTTDAIMIHKRTQEKKVRKIIAVGGQPGTGKTTLFRKFMDGRHWIETNPADLVYAMYNEELDLYILGKYQEGETFAGTDRLSMAVQPKLQEWVSKNNCNILFEGDRVFNQSFLEFCMGLPDTDLQVVYLKTDKETLQQRYLDRGSDQSEKFLKGRETKYNNLLSNFELMSYITEFENSNLDQQEVILEFLEGQISA
jgi:broad-specificity NMP kinase